MSQLENPSRFFSHFLLFPARTGPKHGPDTCKDVACAQVQLKK